MTEQNAPESKSARSKASEETLHVGQLRGGIQFRNKDGRIGRWKDYTRITANNYTGGNGKDQPVVNLIAARVRSIAPQVAFNDPTFEVECVGELPNPNSEAAAAVMLEKCWRDEEVGDITQRVLMDWPMLGRGIWFVGFEAAQEGDVLDSKRAVSDARTTIEKQGAASKIVAGVRKLLGSNTDKPVDPSREARTFSMLLNMRVFAERVSPFNFVLDPCAESPQDATFMARRIFLPLERGQLMFGTDCPPADSLSNVAIYTDASDTDPFASAPAGDAALFPDVVKRVEVWELWDIVNRRTVYIDKAGKIIGETFEWKSAHPGFPFVLVDWDETPDNVYPEGIPAAGITLNNELNEVRKRELAEIGKAFTIFRVNKGMSAENRKLLQEAKDNAVIPLDDDDTLETINRTPMSNDVWTVENRITANFDEITRTSSQDTGSMNAVRRSATEVAAANSGSDATMAMRQSQVEVSAAQIAERMLAGICATFDEPIILRIVNQDPDYIDPATGMLVDVGAEMDYEFIGIDHAAFYKVRVSSGSMASVARDVERQQFGELVQLYGADDFFDRKAAMMHHAAMFTSVKNPGQFVVKAAPQPEIPTDEPPIDQNLPLDAGQEATNGAMMPTSGSEGLGSGNAQADILAGVYGGNAPMTGTNGYPGPLPQ